MQVWFSIWLFLLPVLASTPARAQPRFDLATTQTRLPKTALPSHVNLALDLDPASDTFSGRVSIRLRTLQAMPAIVLHAQALQADAAELAGTRTPARKLRVQPDAATQTWSLVPADGRPVAAGDWTLRIRYRGQVNTAGEGLYRAEYRVDGHPARMLATQLQAVHARRLLPVFDEPVFRSSFELEVRAPKGLQVFSNMPEVQARADGMRPRTHTRHRFAPTPSMPSYLLALTVGRFDVLEDRVDGIPLRIFTVPGKREQARLAMEATKQVLPFYARYFGRPYALPKLDQLAVPGTREGAMEDWGLISYVDDALLFDPARSNEETRRNVYATVVHEIAHQWFGNLVSAASWDEIWLNEAFATWMEKKAASHFHPDWQTGLRARREVDRTMARDATAATRAIRSGPVSEASVFEVFDGVTYDKGGAVLSMLEEWLGEAAFQRGLAAYIAARAYQPATAGDLWAHIGEAAGLAPGTVGAVAASWTDQPGLPRVTVSQRCEAGRTQVTLRQARFSSEVGPLPGGPWQIPLRLARGPQVQTLLVTEAEQALTLPGCESTPLRANAGGRGYYRTEYEPAMRAGLDAAFETLPAADQATLVSDSYALAGAGQRPMAEHLALLRRLPQVREPGRAALFSMGLTQWRELDTAFDGTPAQAPLRTAAHALFGPELERLGWTVAATDDSERQALRAELIQRLADLGHAPTLAAAHARFADALAGTAGVPPSIRAALLQAAGHDAGDTEFESLLVALRNADNQEERTTLMGALAAGHDPVRAQRLLDESLSGRLPQDIRSELPGAVGRTPSLSPQAYAFTVAHWDGLKRLAGEGGFGTLYWLLPLAARFSSDVAVARSLRADQQRLAGAAGESTAALIAAEIETRARLREREAAALAAALAR
jgi:aminopeptidase N